MRREEDLVRNHDIGEHGGGVCGFARRGRGKMKLPYGEMKNHAGETVKILLLSPQAIA